jgi:hypothetical protein
MPRGRQPKIASEDTRKAILDSLRKGALRKDAAWYAGIDPTTLARWLKRGEEPEAESVYRDFRRDAMKAERKAKIDSLSVVQDLATGEDPAVALKAATWYLERRYPAEWGRSDRLRVDARVSAQVEVQEEVELALEDPETRKLLDQLAIRASSINLEGSNSNGNGSAKNGNGNGGQA